MSKSHVILHTASQTSAECLSVNITLTHVFPTFTFQFLSGEVVHFEKYCQEETKAEADL